MLDDFIGYVRFFTLLLPIIIPIMALFDSVFNSNLKGFIYILGLLLTMGTALSIASLISTETKQQPDDACNIFDKGKWGTVNQTRPGTHAVMLAYTFAYLLLPMIVNSTINWWLISTLSLFILLNAGIRKGLKCTDHIGILCGWLIGGIVGAGWYLFINNVTGSSNLTYFGAQKSDKQQCSYRNKTFKCTKSKPAT